VLSCSYSCWAAATRAGLQLLVLGCSYSCWAAATRAGLQLLVLGCSYSCWAAATRAELQLLVLSCSCCCGQKARGTDDEGDGAGAPQRIIRQRASADATRVRARGAIRVIYGRGKRKENNFHPSAELYEFPCTVVFSLSPSPSKSTMCCLANPRVNIKVHDWMIVLYGTMPWQAAQVGCSF